MNYAETPLDYCFEVNAGGRPGYADPHLLTERLSLLNDYASTLGFVSLFDACLSEARLHHRNGAADPNIENFVNSGCLEELFDIFGKRNKTIDIECCRAAEGIYVSEFDKIRQLDVMNQSISLWKADYMSAFNFNDLHSAMRQSAPNLVGLLERLAVPQRGVNIVSPTALPTKYRRVVVMVIAVLAQTRNPSTNFVQAMFSIFLFASKVPKRVLGSLSHVGLCTSYSSVRSALKSAAADSRKRLRGLGAGEMAFITVFDNLTKQMNVRDRRLVNNPEFLTLTAGFVLLPPASRSSPIFSRQDIRTDLISSLRACDFVPSDDDFGVMRQTVAALVASVVKDFASDFHIESSDLNFPMPDIFPIDASFTPEILPLPTYDKDEGIVHDMVDILYSIQSDVGLKEEQRRHSVSILGGDLATVANIRYAMTLSGGLIFGSEGRSSSKRRRQTI